MTSTDVRAALTRRREDRGWSFDEVTADIHRVHGLPVVSSATINNFLRGKDVTPRIEGLLRSYLDKLAAGSSLEA
jgi:transcriptional regulator with XRE-family HTH domain